MRDHVRPVYQSTFDGRRIAVSIAAKRRLGDMLRHLGVGITSRVDRLVQIVQALLIPLQRALRYVSHALSVVLLDAVLEDSHGRSVARLQLLG